MVAVPPILKKNHKTFLAAQSRKYHPYPFLYIIFFFCLVFNYFFKKPLLKGINAAYYLFEALLMEITLIFPQPILTLLPPTPGCSCIAFLCSVFLSAMNPYVMSFCCSFNL